MQQRPLQHTEPDSSVETIDTILSSQHRTEEGAVEISPPEVQTEKVEVLGATLSQEARQFRRRIFLSLAGLSVFGALMIALKSLLGEERWSAFLPSHLIISGTLSVLLLLSLFVVNSTRKPRQRRRALTAQVAEQYDVRAIGPLIDALQLEDVQTREIAIGALTELLPRLKASDATLLNESQRAKLCLLLSLPVESPLHKDVRAFFRPADTRAVAFRVAILQAFEQVGDRKALPIVRQLATREPKTEGEKRIQKAAASCLTALQTRMEQARSSQTLLRAAHAPPLATETLLRPAAGNQEATPEELLRASDPGIQSA